MKVLVIIPAYNEEENIVKVCENIKKIIKTSNVNIDYIVINDGSKDSTYNICLNNNYNVINLINNLGIGGAVQTGYKYALKNNYDIAIQFDGDGQHDASYIKKLIKPILDKKANMVIGSRYIEELSEFKSSRCRQIGIKILSLIIRLFTRKKIYDVTSGFRAVDRNIIELFAKDYPIDYPEPETIVTVLKKNYKIAEIPVKMHDRIGGKSSITIVKSIYYMLKVSFSIIVISMKRG